MWDEDLSVGRAALEPFDRPLDAVNAPSPEFDWPASPRRGRAATPPAAPEVAASPPNQPSRSPSRAASSEEFRVRAKGKRTVVIVIGDSSDDEGDGNDGVPKRRSGGTSAPAAKRFRNTQLHTPNISPAKAVYPGQPPSTPPPPPAFPAFTPPIVVGEPGQTSVLDQLHKDLTRANRQIAAKTQELEFVREELDSTRSSLVRWEQVAERRKERNVELERLLKAIEAEGNQSVSQEEEV